MIVSVTWFLWLALYASTRRWLNWSVAERTHMVSWVPSSGLLLVDLLPPLPQAATASVSAAATAATLRRPRRRTPAGAADRSVPGAISSPSGRAPAAAGPAEKFPSDCLVGQGFPGR